MRYHRRTVPRDPRYDILFEPVQIGPVRAKNRFFQVPHCNGMGYARPRSHAAMRGIKAEGGWAVVSTEEVEIHASSDLAPYVEGRLWDDSDIPFLELMTEAVHRYGALAAIELVHAGMNAPNLYSREPSLAPSPIANPANYCPAQARGMTTADIGAFRRWHRNAAVRARRAGFDIIYVYAGHGLSLPMHFLQRRHNHRADEYGGTLVNRMRLLRELIEDTKDAVGADCAVAVRFAVDELRGADGLQAQAEGREVIAALAELPDLWDVNVSDWANDSKTSRFAQEGYQEEFVRFVKTATSKPVVGVGRFTSPDTMVSQIRRGVLDFIGAARPSIADPFLPNKIAGGDIEDIRECIGCNECVTGDHTMTPIRCTQNPTMGEEWRRGWHPEKVPPRTGSDTFLIVGAGPAGLECARLLGRRGYAVHLVEGRANSWAGASAAKRACRALQAWARVRDYRLGQLNKMAEVVILRGSVVSAEDVIGIRRDPRRPRHRCTMAARRRRTHERPADPRLRSRESGVYAARHHRRSNAQRSCRGVRRRPLLPRWRVGGKAASRWTRGHPRHPGRTGVGLDGQHPRTARHSEGISWSSVLRSWPTTVWRNSTVRRRSSNARSPDATLDSVLLRS